MQPNPVRLALTLLIILSCAFTHSASALSLHWLGRNDSVTRLETTNAPGPRVQLQGSFDLENWFLLAAGAPVEGRFTFTHTNSEPLPLTFYRAVTPADPNPSPDPQIDPRPDPTQSISTLLTPELGGRLDIVDSDGVLYSLLVRSNLVREPVAVRMTVITNFGALPFGPQFRASVMFEPEGLEFRGPAELRIEFPTDPPELELLAYGFNAQGGGFHLRPWTVTNRTAVLEVSHFSGSGVAAVPLPPAPQPKLTYEQFRSSTRDAIRDADHWAGTRYRELSGRRQRNEISLAEFEEQLGGIRAIRNRMIFIQAIQPLLHQAATDCEIGGLILDRLDRLESENGGSYGKGLYYQEMLKLAPKVRCACAHQYIDTCESNPASSGQSARTGLNRILETCQLITGRIDAQGCDLGDDAELDRRLAAAPCHKPWEGVLRFSEVMTEVTNLDYEGGFYQDRIREETSFVGRITRLLSSDGDPAIDNLPSWAAWVFELSGTLAGTVREDSTRVLSYEDFTTTETIRVTANARYTTPGDLHLLFEDDAFDSLSFSAGLAGVKYPMSRTSVEQVTVDCKPGRERFCPPPRGPETHPDGSDDLHFAALADADTPEATVTFANGKLKVTYRRVRVDSQPAPFSQTITWTESWTAELWRSSTP